MYLRTRALDCLYLNWALPRACAPALPPPLRYEIHDWQGAEYVFASALLFRLSGLRLESIPLLRLSYPQMNCRLYVLDEEGLPAVLFRRILVPLWVVPALRMLARQPALAARFSYPPPSREVRADSWRWSVRRRRSLDVSARVASPCFGPGPRLGSWEATLDYFRQRSRGFVVWNRHLRSISTSRASVEVWPLAVEVASAELMAESFEDVDAGVWGAPHSAWLCPEIPFQFELGELRALRLARRGVAAAEGC